MQIALTFDSEDYVCPESDDALIAIAEALRRRGIPATFLIVGELARTLDRRARLDVITALRHHDIGFHTDLHSVHPTLAEYVARSSWHQGVDAIVDNEAAGIEDVTRIFGRPVSAFAPAGFSWAPQIGCAAAAMKVPVVCNSLSHCPPGASPHWYAGALSLRRDDGIGPVDDAVFDGVQYDQFLRSFPSRLEVAAGLTGDIVEVFAHPNRLMMLDFWDVINFAQGKNPAGLFEMPRLRHVRDLACAHQRVIEFVDMLASLDADFVTMSDIAQAYSAPDIRPVSAAEVAFAAVSAGATDGGMAPDGALSAADLAYALSIHHLSGARDSSVSMPVVLGPTTAPAIARTGQLEGDLGEAARALVLHVDRFGELPATVPTARRLEHIHDVYFALLRWWNHELPDGGQFLAGDEPQLVSQLANYATTWLPQWLHDPSIDWTNLATLSGLQAWSIRQARRQPSSEL